MNNPEGKKQSDIDCQKYVDYLNSIGIESRVATKDEDEKLKYDMLVKGVKIDLKNYNSFYCEIDKLQYPHNQAERIMMIVKRDLRHVYSIKKDALIRICAEYVKPFLMLEDDEAPQKNPNKDQGVYYKEGPSSGDKLAYFQISMLGKDDYKVVDLSKILS